MTALLNDMFWPLMACLTLVGIHSYLGVHVIARKVIFVDLALAQIAAVGAVYGVFLGLSISEDSLAIKLISALFTLVGAFFFSITRLKNEKIPHEAIIGIIYALALSLTIILSANLAHGADEVRTMLSGSILWVTPKEVYATAGLYAGVGLIHFIFRRQFWLLSVHSVDCKQISYPRLWDFLFYATFGLVVTSSVGIGGVLLVFGYLVIPSVIAIMMAESHTSRLVLGWALGSIASIIGLYISYATDLPSGPLIVVVLGGMLLVVMLTKYFRPTAINFAILSAAVIIFALTILLPRYFLAHHEEHHTHHRALSISERINAVTDWSSKYHEQLVQEALKSAEHMARQEMVEIIKSKEISWTKSLLIKALPVEEDAFIKIAIADALLGMGEKEAFLNLVDIYEQSDNELIKSEAIVRIKSFLKPTIADDRIKKWLWGHLKQLKFDSVNKQYYE